MVKKGYLKQNKIQNATYVVDQVNWVCGMAMVLVEENPDLNGLYAQQLTEPNSRVASLIYANDSKFVFPLWASDGLSKDKQQMQEFMDALRSLGNNQLWYEPAFQVFNSRTLEMCNQVCLLHFCTSCKKPNKKSLNRMKMEMWFAFPLCVVVWIHPCCSQKIEDESANDGQPQVCAHVILGRLDLNFLFCKLQNKKFVTTCWWFVPPTSRHKFSILQVAM